MSTSAIPTSRAAERAAHSALSLRAALLVTVLIATALAALALWPAKTWAPPRHPGLNPPVVFDELINQPAPAHVDSTTPAAVVH